MGTRPGFLLGREVVEVDFDPKRVSYAELLEVAIRRDCATIVATRTDQQQELAAAQVGKRAIRSDAPIRPDHEPKFYLQRTPLDGVPMTELQKMRVNATLKGNWRQWLSPRQLEQADALLAEQETR